MKYYGEFTNQGGKLCSVTIITNADTSQTAEIGSDGICFSTDPVSIEGETNNTFDVMLTHSASITLLTEKHIDDLFCKSALDAAVTIRIDGSIIFAGFIEPMTYSQPYNEVLDELQLSCIDALSATQYTYYQDIAHGGIYYRQAKREARQRTFGELLLEGLFEVADPLITDTDKLRIFYDGSKAVDNAADTNPYYIFSQLSINDLLFLGEETDDVWTYQTIIEELLRFLNLHIIQVGLNVYIFDWRSLRSGAEVKWQRIMSITTGTEQPTTETLTPTTVTIRNAIAADTDAEISIGEVYNRLQLKADVQSMDAVIESPLDDDLLINAYTSKQLYLEELSSGGEGVTAYEAFKNMVLAKATDWDYAVSRKWFAQVKKNTSWKFAGGGVKDIYAKYTGTNYNQQDFFNALRSDLGAAIIAFGNVEGKSSETDNSPVSTVSMENCLIIPVNGNADDTETGFKPNADDIKAAIPVATYTGNTTGGVFSPVDDKTRNYIVISGKLILNPLMNRTDNITVLKKAFNGETVTEADCDDHQHYLNYLTSKAYGAPYRGCTVDIETDGGQHDNRYYTQKIYRADTPRSDTEEDTSIKWPLCPFTDEVRKQYEFKYSAVGDGTDTISKVPVLCCMLVIGDKCVVEPRMEDVKEYEDVKPNHFEWREYKTLEECADEEEYYAQSFTIGFDPKIGDKLVGTEFSIANNIEYQLGLNVEGTAIQILRSDHVSGEVQFKILGVCNLIWGDVVRKHGTFWRHTSWRTDSIPLLAHVSSVILKEFEMKVYSDNGMESTDEDNDYVYYSDTDETYYNKKDDLEFKLTSALTTEEAVEMGVANKVAYSTPQDYRTGDAITTIYDTQQDITAKAEQLYVDAYYQEYHTPKLELTQKVLLGDKLGIEPTELWRTLFYHPAPDKTFYPQAVSLNLMQNYAKLNLKTL